MGLSDLVEVREGVDYLGSLREMSEADVLVLVEAPAETNLFLPSKLVDYLGAGPPVLAITPSRGPAARLLTDPVDRVMAPENTEGIAAALLDYIRRFRNGELTSTRRSADAVASLRCEATAGILAEVIGRVSSRAALG